MRSVNVFLVPVLSLTLLLSALTPAASAGSHLDRRHAVTVFRGKIHARYGFWFARRVTSCGRIRDALPNPVTGARDWVCHADQGSRHAAGVVNDVSGVVTALRVWGFG